MVALFWVLVIVYVVLISIMSCYETDAPIIFLQASKILLTKNWNVRVYFEKKKDSKKHLRQEELMWCVKKKKMLFWRSLEEDFIYACVFEEGWKYV